MNADTSDIHRLLDEAFAGVTMTPDVQDLKEELRGSLAARSAELQSRGMDARTAAATAVDELGDIRGLIASVGEGDGRPGPDLRLAAFEIARQERVRPKPSFVIRAALCGVVIALSAVVIVLAALGVSGATVAEGIGFAVVLGVAIALVAADGLRQETTVHHRMPAGRAWGYGLAGGALGAGVSLAGLFAGHADQVALLVAGVVLAVAGGVALIARRHPDQPRQAVGARPGAAVGAAGPLLEGSRRRGAVRHLHRRHLDRRDRGLRRAQHHRRLRLVVARPRRRDRGVLPRAEPHALRDR